MPEIRHYIVTQERQIKIWAHREEDAAIIAASIFNSTTPAREVEGGAESQIRNLSLNVSRAP